MSRPIGGIALPLEVKSVPFIRLEGSFGSAQGSLQEGLQYLGPVAVEIITEKEGEFLFLKIGLTPRRQVRLSSLSIILETSITKVLENGYQSWSPVRWCEASDFRPERTKNSLSFINSSLFSNPEKAGSAVLCDDIAIFLDGSKEGGAVAFLGSSRHFGTIAMSPERLEVRALLDNIELSQDTGVQLHEIAMANGEPGVLYEKALELVAKREGVLLDQDKPIPAGWCSWYQYFGSLEYRALEENLLLLKEFPGLEVFQIDDGYQRFVGDWLKTKDDLPSLEELAARIRAARKIPGIWTAPFLASERSELVHAHPDWVLRDESGAEVIGAINPSWGGRAFCLDLTNNAVLTYLQEVFSSLKDMGFEYFKIDFCYAPCTANHAGSGNTRAAVLSRALKAIREAVGSDSWLLGCGCPFGPAAGVVDGMRISPDTAPYDSPRFYYWGFKESAPALENALRASLLRAPYHGRLFAADPDCVILRKEQGLSEKLKQLHAELSLALGGYFMVSDDLSRYSEREAGLLLSLLEKRAGLSGWEPPRFLLTPEGRVGAGRADIWIESFADFEQELSKWDEPVI